MFASLEAAHMQSISRSLDGKALPMCSLLEIQSCLS